MNKTTHTDGHAEYAINKMTKVILFHEHLVPEHAKQGVEAKIEEALGRLNGCEFKISITIAPGIFYQGSREICVIGYIDNCVATRYYEKDLCDVKDYAWEIRRGINDIYWQLQEEIVKRIHQKKTSSKDESIQIEEG